MEKHTSLIGVPRWKAGGSSAAWRPVKTVSTEVVCWKEESQMAFSSIPSASKPIGQWHNDIAILDPFNAQKPAVPLRLTTPEAGLYHRVTDCNLAEIAQFLIQKFEFLEVGGALALYHPPCWEVLTSRQATSKVYSLVADCSNRVAHYMSSYALNEIIAHIMNSPDIQHLEQFPLPDYHFLCCLDGLYNWPNDRICNSTSQDLRFTHLEVLSRDIGPSPTPYFDAFLEAATCGDDDLAQLILEVIGVIISGYPSKSFFLFEGVADSGKSQLARFLQNILGPTSCFAVNGINQLSDRWTTGMLPGKLLCVCADVPDKPLSAATIGTVKQLTGDDPIRGELKYQSPFVFQNTAKLLFLSNFPLRLATEQQDSALSRRLVRVPFHYAVPEEKQVPRFHEKLLSEAGGIIWKSMQALITLDERNGMFTEIQSEFESSDFDLFPSDQDQVKDFVYARCSFDPIFKTAVADLYAAFISFNEDAKNSISVNKFGKILSSCGFPIRPCRNSTTRCYQGIRLADGYVMQKNDPASY